jgi:hypothetical protein
MIVTRVIQAVLLVAAGLAVAYALSGIAREVVNPSRTGKTGN